jgi:hypothetical protein
MLIKDEDWIQKEFGYNNNDTTMIALLKQNPSKYCAGEFALR